MTQVPSTKINLVSDIPISVVGHNYYNGTGDSFGGARFIFISSLVAVTFKVLLPSDIKFNNRLLATSSQHLRVYGFSSSG